jgi:endonuclease/exonuclease/phosphatase family metal-dependent hydrolase
VHGAWPGRGGDNATELGSRLGLSSVFIPTERRWWHDNFGNGLLSRMPLQSVHQIPLPGTQGCKYRNAILASFTHNGKDIRLLATHVDRIGDHDRQLRSVIDLFLQLESPAILMGDLNSKADDPQLRALLDRSDVSDFACEQWPDGRKPLRRVDWIILRGLRCVNKESRDLGASDHAAVCAEIELIDEVPPDSLKQVGYQSIVPAD